MLTPDQVTACLVTRGDQPDMMAAIQESLIFDDVVIWNNAEREDKKAAGRYFATLEAKRKVVYYQDDDCLIPPATQQTLLHLYKQGVLVANYGHGDTPDGYDDVALVHGGALVDRGLSWEALNRYLAVHPEDDEFLYEADFIAGLLTPHRHVHLPYHIVMEVAQHPSRMCNQPWQRDLKLKITERARAIRDCVPSGPLVGGYVQL
jgi:hypothetical protein